MKPKTGFSMSYVAVPLFVFSELRREVKVFSFGLKKLSFHSIAIKNVAIGKEMQSYTAMGNVDRSYF
jgi:hypothetical protein